MYNLLAALKLVDPSQCYIFSIGLSTPCWYICDIPRETLNLLLYSMKHVIVAGSAVSELVALADDLVMDRLSRNIMNQHQ